MRARLVCVASVWVALAAALTGCPPSGGAPSPTPTASAPAGERFTLRIEAAGDDPAAVIAVVSSLRGCARRSSGLGAETPDLEFLLTRLKPLKI